MLFIALDKNKTLLVKYHKALTAGLREGSDFLFIPQPKFKQEKQVVILYPDILRCIFSWLGLFETINWAIVSSSNKVDHQYMIDHLMVPLFGKQLSFNFQTFSLIPANLKRLADFKDKHQLPQSLEQLSQQKEWHIELLMNNLGTSMNDYQQVVLVDDKIKNVESMNSFRAHCKGILAQGLESKVDYLLEIAQVIGLMDLAKKLALKETSLENMQNNASAKDRAKLEIAEAFRNCPRVKAYLYQNISSQQYTPGFYPQQRPEYQGLALPELGSGPEPKGIESSKVQTIKH